MDQHTLKKKFRGDNNAAPAKAKPKTPKKPAAKAPAKKKTPEAGTTPAEPDTTDTTPAAPGN